MIKEDNIIDLSDYADRDIKEEVAHIRESITSLERLIEVKERNGSDDADANLTKMLRASIRENMEELSMPVEAKCDALEAKLNVLQESVNQMRENQSIRGKLLIVNVIGILFILIMNLCLVFVR